MHHKLLARLQAVVDTYCDEEGYKSDVSTRGDMLSGRIVLSLDKLVKDEQGNTVTQEEKDFKQFAKVYGAEADWLNKTFKVRRKTFQIVGLNPSASKNCIIMKDERGKTFVCSPSQVRSYLNA